MTRTFAAIVAALALALPLSGVRADSGWLLTGADFKQRPVALDTINDTGLSARALAGNTAVNVAFDQFLQIDRATPPRAADAKFNLVLVSGDRLAGTPGAIEGEKLVWTSQAVGQLNIPLKQIRAVVRAAKPVELPDAAPSDDLLTLANGDSVKGIVTALAAGKITIQSGDAPLTVPLDNITSIQLAAPAKPQPIQGRAFRVRLSDGSLITALAASVRGDKLSITLPDKSQRTFDLPAVNGIEQLNGPVAWLTSRAPATAAHTPWFDRAFPTRFDTNVSGRPIRFENRLFVRGIGVHARSVLTYTLDATEYEAFRTQYAIDPEGNGGSPDRRYADVDVRILLDDKPVHETKHFKSGVLSPVVIVPLQGAKTLTLEVDYGASADTQDHFNWIEPALLRKMPPAPAPLPPATVPASNP